MSLARLFIVLRLLISGEAKLIRLCLYAIPIIFCVIFYSFLLGDKVLSYFDSYMQKSYIGVMGELTITSPSTDFLSDLHNDAKKSSLNVSIKMTNKKLLAVNTKQLSLVKGFEVYAYDSDYLKRKFSGYDPRLDTLIVSSIVAKQLDINESHAPLFLGDPHREKRIEFSKVIIVDLGFLTSDPIIIMSVEQYKYMIGSEAKYNQLEFHKLPVLGKEKVENLAKELFNKGGYSSYKIIDTRDLSSEHRTIFDALEWLSHIIFIILILLNFLLCLLSIKTLLSAKKRAISTMQLLGMTSQELWGYIFVMWGGLFIVSYAFSYALLSFTGQQVIHFIF